MPRPVLSSALLPVRMCLATLTYAPGRPRRLPGRADCEKISRSCSHGRLIVSSTSICGTARGEAPRMVAGRRLRTISSEASSSKRCSSYHSEISRASASSCSSLVGAPVPLLLLDAGHMQSSTRWHMLLLLLLNVVVTPPSPASELPPPPPAPLLLLLRLQSSAIGGCPLNHSSNDSYPGC